MMSIRDHHPLRWSKWVKTPLLGLALIGLAGCGGSSGSGQSQPVSPSFTLAARPASPSIAPGTSSVIQIGATGQNGFTGTVSVTIAGLPSGLSAAPSSFSVTNEPQSITLTAAPSLANGTYPITLNGVAGGLTASATVNVQAGSLQNFELIGPLSPQVVTRFGSSAQLQLQTVAQGLGTSNYLVNLSTQGLPAGVTATFSPNPIAVGYQSTVTLNPPSSGQWIQSALFTIVGTATAAAPSETLPLDLVVAPAPGNLPNNRTTYLRTDDTPQSIVYDSVHRLLFSSDYFLNRVDVVSTNTQQILRSIPVKTPKGLALTLDGTQVLVASDAQQIVAISTTSLKVVQQWALPRLTPTESYGTTALFPLADGTVAVHVTGLNGGPWQLAIWQPSLNRISPVQLPAGLSDDPCFVAGSGNGTKILIANCSGPSDVVLYDVSSSTFSAPLQFPGYIFNIAANFDGSQFFISDDTLGVGLYNNQLQNLAYLIPPDPFCGFIFSSDGSRIYLVAGLIATFDSSGNLLNTAPALGTIPPGEMIEPSPFVETPFAVDSTGLIFGSADHGIAFDDSTYSVSFVSGFGGPPDLDPLLTPASGPLNVATPTSFPEEIVFTSVPDVWFGSGRATQASIGSGSFGQLSVTAPPSSQSGPVSIKIIEPNGFEAFNPLGFSYGPNLMFVNGDIAAPAGGANAHLVGIGLPTDPTQIQVTVGGKPSTVISAAPVKFSYVFFPGGYPYPATDVVVTLPPGQGDADLQITTPAGSAKLSKAVHYAKSVTDYPSPDTFQSLTLDRKRNQLYLSAGDHIDVFSLATNQFLAPFTPPALNGQKNFHGLALTPDGSELVATNFSDGTVALINPDQPTSATAVQIIPPGTFGNPGPENVVTMNNGQAFIEPRTTQDEGCGASFYELNLSNLQVLPISNLPFFCIQPEGFPLAASVDGSKVLLTTTDTSGPQSVAIFDVATNTWTTNNTVLENFGGNAAVSTDGSVLATGSGIMDASADLLGYLAWQEAFESGAGFSLPLEKAPDGGSLVYVPYQGYVDLFDAQHGALLHRLTLTEQIESVTDAMVLDAFGRNIYLLTNKGLTVVQLSGAPLAIGVVAPATGAGGATVTIHGSGFQTGTSVFANGTPVATMTLLDANTLQIGLPSLPVGSTQISVTNPSGETYSLDNAFTVQ